MQAPPSRYRVIERGGRLVVIDTQRGGRPQTAADLLPGLASDDRDAPALAWQDAPDPERVYLLDRPAPVAPVAPAPAPRPSAAEALIAQPDFVRSVAATTCSDARDGDGNLILTTASWYDRKGPRSIALDPRGERELGTAVLVLLGLAVAAIVAAVVFGAAGLVLLGIAATQLGQVKTVATPWLDRLGVTRA